MDKCLTISYSILIIESDFKHAQYIKIILELACNNIQVFISKTLDTASELIKHTSIDIFIIEPYLNSAKYNGIDFTDELLVKKSLTQVIFQSHMEDFQYRAKLHKKFTHAPFILRSSLVYEQELKDNVRYAIDFLAMTANRQLVLDKKSNSFFLI